MQKKDRPSLAEAFHTVANWRQMELARALSNNIQLMQGWLHAAIYTPRYSGINPLLQLAIKREFLVLLVYLPPISRSGTRISTDSNPAPVCWILVRSSIEDGFDQRSLLINPLGLDSLSNQS